MIEATNNDDSRDLVFLATKSLTVHTNMTTVNATTGIHLVSNDRMIRRSLAGEAPGHTST